MKILLDTHYLIWLATDLDELTQPERRLLGESGREFMVSAISLWELRLKGRADRRRGVLALALAPDQAIRFARESDLAIVVPAVEDYAADLSVPLDHKDPFDEMLLIHAQQLGARLLTRDGKLRLHPLALAA